MFSSGSPLCLWRQKVVSHLERLLGPWPSLLQAGDLVCVLAGGAIPFVLRQDLRSSPSKRRFKLVGEAYVHGIMHGEAADRCTVENSSTVAFTII
jgi:hypothetical protein